MNKLTIILAAICMPLVVFAPAHAQDEFSLHFDAAHIVGNDQSIFVHRVPVTNQKTGEIVLKDIIVEFVIAEDGSIIVDTVFSDTSVPVPNSANNFIPGTYEDSAGNRLIVSIGGTLPDGRSSGSIRLDNADELSFNATWVTGSVAGNPLVENLPIAAELTEGPTYGIIGFSDIFAFCQGRLAAFAQIGQSITVTAYHQPSFGSGACGSPGRTSNPNTSFGLASFTIIRSQE